MYWRRRSTIVNYLDNAPRVRNWIAVGFHCFRAIIGAAIAFQLAAGSGQAAGGAAGNGPDAVSDRSPRVMDPPTCATDQPDGTTDDSACVQRMVDALCNVGGHRGGGLVLLGPGHWKFHDITVRCDGVHIKGAGIGNDSMASNAQSTSVDCREMTDHCIQFIPNGFPSRYRMRGGSVEGIRFVVSGKSGRVLDFLQVEDGYARDISIWDPFDGIRLYGVNTFNLAHIRQWGAKGTQYEIMGDLSGKASNGGACTLGDCSTRTDWVVLRDLYSTAFPSSDFVYIHDQAFTIEGNAIANENGRSGLKVRCAAGKPNLSYCPQQIIMTAFTVEYPVAPVDLSDFTWFRCVSCYMAGAGRRTVHVLQAQLTNYSQGKDGAGGGVTLSDSQIYGAAGSCVYSGVTDVTIAGSQIYGCNMRNVAAAGIEFARGAQHHITDTTFCKSIGVAPTAMTGILVDRDASQIAVTAPMYYGCTAGLVNNSASARTVTTVNAQGP